MAANPAPFNGGLALKRMLGIALAMALGGCGENDRFAAGTWQVDAWMESDAGSGRDMPGVHQKDTVKITKEDERWPAATTFFTRFYHGAKGDVRFANGKVEGQLDQGRVDDIAAHTVPVTGTYGRDRFHVTFEFTVFGTKARQVVEGRLVTPA